MTSTLFVGHFGVAQRATYIITRTWLRSVVDIPTGAWWKPWTWSSEPRLIETEHVAFSIPPRGVCPLEILEP
jgi:hypothetical protein